MNIATRLTLFFLGVLGLVLIAFSLTLYAFSTSYLNRRMEERLGSALGTLMAAIEVTPNGLEWEPSERRITLGSDVGEEQVRWTIQDSTGRILAHSNNMDGSSDEIGAQMKRTGANSRDDMTVGQFADDVGNPWVWKCRRLQAGANDHSVEAVDATAVEETESDPYESNERYSEITITAAASLGPDQRVLRMLLASSLGVSACLWSIAALASRRICRQALAPLTAMSDAAKEITASKLNLRLPSPNTGDEIAELANSFNDLLGRVQDAYGKQQRFTAEASHQLRTPLAGLLGQIEVARRKPRTLHEFQTVLESVHEQGLHLTRLVDTLLLLARPESESGPIQIEKIDLVVWTQLQLERWSDHPRARDLEIVDTQQPIPVATHPLLLSQLFDNLLDNALKYSEIGTAVTLLVGREGEHPVVEIMDHGIGMLPDELRELFEPFFRSGEVRRLGIAGAGLGLAVVRRIAQVLNISIAVTSEIGRGCSFKLVFPNRLDNDRVCADGNRGHPSMATGLVQAPSAAVPPLA